jgi:synembryn-A
VNKKKKLLDYLFKYLRDLSYVKHFHVFLVTLRILTRDKADLENLFTIDRIETLLHLAQLAGEDEALMIDNLDELGIKVVIGAQKCLSNLVFNSNIISKICCHNRCVDGIMLRMRLYKDPQLPMEVKYFDMRLLFLITALNSEMCVKIRDEHHGIVYLMEAIDLILKESQEFGYRKNEPENRENSEGQKESFYRLNNQAVEACCEVLKVLFNLTASLDKINLDEV